MNALQAPPPPLFVGWPFFVWFLISALPLLGLEDPRRLQDPSLSRRSLPPVSYTHLTLPTILLV
eukprot:5497511-Pyramimonas_sp.AAC.1